MKVAVIAESAIRKEFQAKINGGEIQLIWADEVSDLFEAGQMDAYFDFNFEMKRDRIDMLARLLPKPVFINSVVHTLDSIGKPFIRINAWPTFLKREITELTTQAGPAADAAQTFLNGLHWKYEMVPDKPGMISARIISMIINEAYYTAQENVSSKEDIDIAMKLGTNYPYGPFEWSKIIGLRNILELLEALRETDDRYTISEMLAREARDL